MEETTETTRPRPYPSHRYHRDKPQQHPPLDIALSQQHENHHGFWYMGGQTPSTHWDTLLQTHTDGADRTSIILIEPQKAPQQALMLHQYKEMLAGHQTNGKLTQRELIVPQGTVPYLTSDFYTGKTRTPLKQYPTNNTPLAIYVLGPAIAESHITRTTQHIRDVLRIIHHMRTSPKPDIHPPPFIDLHHIFPEYTSICPIIQEPGYPGSSKRQQWRFKTADILTHAGALHPKVIRGIQLTLDCSINLKTGPVADQAQATNKERSHGATFLRKISTETLEYSRRLFKATREVRAHALAILNPTTRTRNYFSCLEEDETVVSEDQPAPPNETTTQQDQSTAATSSNLPSQPLTNAPTASQAATQSLREATDSDSDTDAPTTSEALRVPKKRRLRKVTEVAQAAIPPDTQAIQGTAQSTSTSTIPTAPHTTTQVDSTNDQSTTPNASSAIIQNTAPTTTIANYSRQHGLRMAEQQTSTSTSQTATQRKRSRPADHINNNDDADEANADLSLQHPSKKAHTTDPGPGGKGPPQEPER